MQYREFYENNINLEKLTVDTIEQKKYEIVHENTVIVCHDVFIRTEHDGEKGILLVKRLNHPAKNVYWPVGGRVLRGISTEESLRKKVEEECSLALKNIEYLATARTFFKEEPFGHNKGTDTINLVYVADGVGEPKLNSLHTSPLIVTRENYQDLRPTLDPYSQTYLDSINEKNLW